MAAQKDAYPLLSVAHWWALRAKFKQTIPGTITADYLATVLSVQPVSAKNNVLPTLKKVGLVLDGGKTDQVLASRWRDDSQYEVVCTELLDRLYPAELRDAHPSPDPKTDRDAIIRWFMNRTSVGTSGAGKMAAFYLMLSGRALADVPSKGVRKEAPAGRASATNPAQAKSVIEIGQPLQEVGPAANGDIEAPVAERGGVSAPRRSQVPGIHINVQVHISSDASADQIDQIFASMARHLYGRD